MQFKVKPPEEIGLTLPPETFAFFTYFKNICDSWRGNATAVTD